MTKDTSRKKAQFTQKKVSKKPLLLFGAAGLLALLLVVVVLLSGQKEVSGSYFGAPVAAPRSYIGQVISMTPIEPAVEGDLVRIPLALVEEHNIIRFELENDEGVLVPLMAYITPTGRLFAGSSMCEPCQGRTYSLAGETLVCDTCRTTYTIEDHQFLSGARACGAYPPVNMNPKVVDGMIVLELEAIRNWRIRA